MQKHNLWSKIFPDEAHTNKKEKKIFLIYKEIQTGSVAKSYMRKGFLIYEEMRKYLTIYEEAVSHIWLYNRFRLNLLIYIFYLWVKGKISKNNFNLSMADILTDYIIRSSALHSFLVKISTRKCRF